MAKQKIDEQISYNWLFVILAGAFMFVTGWAVWDETVSRREYKEYQERFFEIEEDLAKAEYELQRDLLDPAACPAACAGMLEGKKNADETCEQEVCAKAQEYVALQARRDEILNKQRAMEDEIKAMEAEIAQIAEEEFEVTQTMTFTKAEWSEQDYYLRLARHAYLSDPDNSELEAAFKQERDKAMALKERSAKESAVVEAAIKKRKEAEAKLAEATGANELKDVIKQIETLARPEFDAKRKWDTAKANKGGLFGAKTKVDQYNLPRIETVDRCTSCHVGATRGGFEEVAETVFKTHKFRRTFFKYHPPEEFGCTSCHDGQGKATTKFYAHAPSNDEDPHAFHTHYWERPVLKGPPGGEGREYMQAKCRGCHVEQVELRSRIFCDIDAECAPLSTEEAPVTCNVPNLEGDAKARDSLAKLPGMPSVEVDPDAEVVEPEKVCTDRRGNALLVNLAPVYSAGVEIVEEVGCYGCHPIEGFRDMPKVAPDLTQVSKKIDPSYMVSWIQYPKAHRPNSRMPNFFPEVLDPDNYPYPVDPKEAAAKREYESTALTAFLLHQSANSEKYDYVVEPLPVGLTGDAARGKQEMATLGCAACHNLPGDAENTPKRINRASHFDHGPDLSDMGSKTSVEWIYSWIRNPRRYNPVTRMPSLRLTEQEALDIATYLGTLRGEIKFDEVSAETLANEELIAEGKVLVKQYGCFGCHLVEGFEDTPGIGADLSAFGVKLRERLDFGDYITDHNQQTWNNWLISKLRHPRVYAYEAQSPVVLYMPEFEFNEDEIRKVMTFLKSNRGDEDLSPKVLRQQLSEAEHALARGRTMVRRFNCNGCHDVDGHEGEMASLPSLSGSNAINGPPPLTNEGLKTQPSWLFEFIRSPFRMRPRPQIRMPTFGFTDVEATTLVRMFSAMDDVRYPFTYYGGVGPVNPDEQKIGKAIFEAAGCQQCHVVGELGPGPVPDAIKAPNLLMGQSRLRPDWLELWLADPGALQKNTAMPSFWMGGNQMEMYLQTNAEFQAAMQGVDPEMVKKYAASPLLQIEATRNFLFRMEPTAPQ